MLTPVFNEYILKLFQPRPMISLLVLIALVAVFYIMSRKTVFNTRTLAYGALSISLAFVLSFVKLAQFPNGGTITLASMLPLIAFSYIAGPRAGVMAGFCYGLLQFIQEPFLVHWAQFFLDYPLAFAMLGMGGLIKNNIYAGTIVASLGRFVCHFLSGVVFFASYAGEQNVFIYSAIYNMSYILPDAILCLVILAVPKMRHAILREKGSMV